MGNSNTLNQNGEKNVLTDVSIMGNKNIIENGTAGAYTQTVKQNTRTLPQTKPKMPSRRNMKPSISMRPISRQWTRMALLPA